MIRRVVIYYQFKYKNKNNSSKRSSNKENSLVMTAILLEAETTIQA